MTANVQCGVSATRCGYFAARFGPVVRKVHSAVWPGKRALDRVCNILSHSYVYFFDRLLISGVSGCFSYLAHDH